MIYKVGVLLWYELSFVLTYPAIPLFDFWFTSASCALDAGGRRFRVKTIQCLSVCRGQTEKRKCESVFKIRTRRTIVHDTWPRYQKWTSCCNLEWFGKVLALRKSFGPS